MSTSFRRNGLATFLAANGFLLAVGVAAAAGTVRNDPPNLTSLFSAGAPSPETD